MENQNLDRIIRTGQQVLATEASALAHYSTTLDHSFAQAVVLMLGVTGRIIVAGMGKSGHVGKKIASTFASTGTPAQFVHPAEASHGDLGMITRRDVVLVLSNSGETSELADLIAYAKRFDIPVIGVASKPNSTLVMQSDIAILLPDMPEACAVGMAPTTSTTLMLALGDALAVALMECRKFTTDEFREFHPAGNLGAKLVRVSDLMHHGDAIPIASVDAKMSDILLLITGKGFGVAGIVDENGALVGIITDGDLRRHMDGLLGLTAGEVMTRSPKTAAPSMLASQALGDMNERRITTLFVVAPDANGVATGILHIHDCLRAGVV